jgi:hypothetical protein
VLGMVNGSSGKDQTPTALSPPDLRPDTRPIEDLYLSVKLSASPAAEALNMITSCGWSAAAWPPAGLVWTLLGHPRADSERRRPTVQAAP